MVEKETEMVMPKEGIWVDVINPITGEKIGGVNAPKKLIGGPKKKKTAKKMHPAIAAALKSSGGLRYDLGCGPEKHQGFVGVDFREGLGIDIVQDLTMFPWRELPDGLASTVMTSHVNEHINPASSNPQLAALIDLMLAKKLLTREEVENTVGTYRFLGGFVAFMDEVWRITKVGGQFMMSHPYSPSMFYVQDPTHVNMINERTYTYFDPLAKEPFSGIPYNLYQIYHPMPWKIISMNYTLNGFMEVLLEKRAIDPSYKCSGDNGMTIK